MLDRRLLALLKPAMDASAARLVRAGVGADHVTLLGFALGVGAAAAIARRSAPGFSQGSA